MVDQPAYLRNLKAYAKSKVGLDEDAIGFANTIFSESHRGAIILAATMVEDALQSAIIKRFPTLQVDEAAAKQVFEIDGPMASFSRRTLIAYGLGIIDKEYRNLIDLIREIRNACAHSRQPISMTVPELTAACSVIISDMLPGLLDREPVTLLNAFVTKCAFINIYIDTGIKHEGPEAQVRYWSQLTQAPGSSPQTPK